MNIRYRDRDPEIPSGGSNPITDATARRRRAGSHNGPHELPRCTLVYCGRATLSLRRKGRDRRRANPEQHDALRSAEMICGIIVEPGYLKVDLFNQQTAAETRDALRTIAVEARKCKSSQILISVHASRPIFKVERWVPDRRERQEPREGQEQRQHRPRRNQESISLDSSGGMSA